MADSVKEACGEDWTTWQSDEEARAICLLDCTQTPRDANGDYLATVEDSGIVNDKLMIWDG